MEEPRLTWLESRHWLKDVPQTHCQSRENTLAIRCVLVDYAKAIGAADDSHSGQRAMYGSVYAWNQPVHNRPVARRESIRLPLPLSAIPPFAVNRKGQWRLPDGVYSAGRGSHCPARVLINITFSLNRVIVAGFADRPGRVELIRRPHYGRPMRHLAP